MWRFVLVAGIVLAVSLVLWSTWRLDRRLFTGVSVALALFGIVFGFGAWQGSQQALITIPHGKIAFELENTRQLETGLRIKGELINQENQAAAVVTLTVNQLICEAEGSCAPMDSARIVIRRHINAEASAPISEVVRLSSSKDKNVKYEVLVSEAKGYKQAKGQSGLLIP